jgi:ACS family hexuronate transporter-like MFS transporter
MSMSSVTASPPVGQSISVGHTRWVMLSLLFFATVINYIDRQVVGILKPTIAADLGWSEMDYANIVFYFQMAYAIGYVFMGRLMDVSGVRRGYSLAVLLWSLAAIAHGFVRSVFGFAVARFALGLGESGNYPACIKTTRTWFPASERALATGIFNAGTNVGAMVTPFLVPWLTIRFGWPAAFFTTGALGFAWLVAWWLLYQDPERHPRVSAAERAYIRRDPEPPAVKVPYHRLLRWRTTWAYALANVLSAPIWWFYLFWLPDFLSKTHGLNITGIGLPLVVIYLMTDAGSVAGGALSSALIARGINTLAARKLAMLVCLLLIVPVILAPSLSSLWGATLIIGLAASAHQGWTANIWTLVTDALPRPAVSSVFGFGGMVGAVGGMVIAKVAGYVLETTGSYVVLFLMIPACYALGLLLLHIIMPRRPESVAV